MTKTFDDFLKEVSEQNPRWRIIPHTAYQEAALLYGESKWNQACEKQREFCCKELADSRTADNLDRIKILAAHKPTFKP